MTMEALIEDVEVLPFAREGKLASIIEMSDGLRNS